MNLSFEDLRSADFVLYPSNPVIRRFGTSPVVADPSVLTPSLSPDGRWHLFAHTLSGIFEFISDDGISFGKGRKIVSRAMRPHILATQGKYILFFERLQTLPARAAGFLGGVWKSDIYAIESRDLKSFSQPFPVLTFDKAFEKVGRRGHSLSNPFVLEDGGKYVMYYSAGLTYVPDCKFTEPTYICRAVSDSPAGGYVKDPAPVLAPDPGSRLFNLCCGCLKVYKLNDGYAGIQNGIYSEKGASKSAIQLLYSQDGINFTFSRTLIKPDPHVGDGWMAQFVYASHLVYEGGELKLYFNARDKAFMLSGREHIGLATAAKK